MQLLRIAREIEDEMWTVEGIHVKGAKEMDPQVKEVVEALKDFKKQVEKTTEPLPLLTEKSKLNGRDYNLATIVENLVTGEEPVQRGIPEEKGLFRKEGCHPPPKKLRSLVLLMIPHRLQPKVPGGMPRRKRSWLILHSTIIQIP